MGQICEVVFSLMPPFYRTISKYRGYLRTINLEKHVDDLPQLRRNAQLLIPLISKNYWIKFDWFLKDLPPSNFTLFTDVSSKFGA